VKLWCAIDCKFIECATQTEQLFKGKMMAYLQTLQLSGRNSTEVLLNVTPEKAEQYMRSAHETVCEELSVESQQMTIRKLELENQRLQTLLELKRMGVDVGAVGAALNSV
jgi:hypothetical protein